MSIYSQNREDILLSLGIQKENDQANSYHVPSWLHNCTDIYMDLGSNIGVQIKKLFEPEKYPVTNKRLRKVMELYTQEFGKPVERKRNNSGLCALGFEPNPKHQERLKKLEKKYNEQGWKVHFFPYAISDEDKQILFYTKNDSKETEDWGASLFDVKKEKDLHPYVIKSISLSKFLNKYFKGKQIKLMKMDIEGAEFEVLTDLLFQKLLCKNVIKAIMIEFHGKILKNVYWRLFFDRPPVLTDMIKSQISCNATRIMHLDDESYLHDVE